MNNILGYTAVFFYRTDDHGTQVLLQKKDRGWRGIDLWTPFGGRMEVGEDPVSCVKREILEELHIVATDEQLQYIKVINTTTKDGQVVPLHIYTALFTGEISDIRLHEGCGFAFWYTDELPALPMQPHEKIAAEEVVTVIGSHI